MTADDELIRRGDALAALQEWTYCSDAEDAIRALPAVAPAVKVKPLVWEHPCVRNNQTHIARSIFGEYYVHIDGGRHQAWLEANIKPYENTIGEVVGTLSEAQAAAQADYEARILAALEPSPTEADLDAAALARPAVKALVEAVGAIAADASVVVQHKKDGKINNKRMYDGWRKIAVERIDIARAAVAALPKGDA